MTILTNRELAVLLCTLPDSVPRLSEMEDRLAIGPEYGSPWYSSQKEHMIGWAADFEGPGAYLRRATGLSSARKLYSQLVCTPALYWLIAASGVNEEIYGYAWEKAMLRPQIRMASRSGQLRTAVPWHFVNIALRRREPVSRMEWILALDVIVAAQRKLRERAYTAKAIKAAKIFSQQDIIQTMNIDQIINTLPQKTFDERKRMLENAEKWLASGEDTKMAHAKKLIDALNTLQEQERIALNAKLTGMSDSQRVADAFRIAPPTETEIKILSVLAAHPGSTSTELSQHLGWNGQSWHMHFGVMCQKREQNLWPSEPSQKRDAQFFCGILAELNMTNHTWTLKPEVQKALIEIGVL